MNAGATYRRKQIKIVSNSIAKPEYNPSLETILRRRRSLRRRVP
jgi:hypothetical protein